MSTDDGPRAEAFYGAIQRLVPIPEGLRALPVRRVVAHRADEQVPHGSRRHQSGGPDLPICSVVLGERV